jgi:hypothetical protein
MGHRPYFSSGAHGDVTGKPKLLLDNTVIGTVDMYVSGHDHQLSDEDLKTGTKLIISGAGGKTKPLKKKPRKWGASALGYVVLEIEENVGRYEFRQVTGAKVDTIYQDIVIGQGIR